MGDLIGGMTNCFNPTFSFPGVGEPGLPNFALGCFLGTMAGITYVLQFLPPNPQNLPSLPSIGLFMSAFMGPLKVPGLTMPAPPGFSPTGVINLVLATVNLIFKLFTGIIKSIISLSPKLPTVGLAIDLFKQLVLEFNVPKDVPLDCIPKGIVGLITELVPV